MPAWVAGFRSGTEDVLKDRQVDSTGAQLQSVSLQRQAIPFVEKMRLFLALTKPLQTALLLVTGVCAYALTLPGMLRWKELVWGGLALVGSIAGCTALNMVLDRDIDAQMGRTAGRPLPVGGLSVRVAILFGLVLAIPGLGLAWSLQPLFGFLVSLGLAIDLGVYTLWLKRRTPFSILWGGVSGGMPALAGRALALGRVDAVGVLLAAGVLLWIPAHILTLSTHYGAEYRRAGVPVWPNRFGISATRRVVAIATLGAAVVLALAGMLLDLHSAALVVLGLMGGGLSALALVALVRPSERINWLLFKAASIYMLGAFVCLTLGTVM